MAPELPPRRFAPMPVETSSTSSRKGGQEDNEVTPKPPRRFNVEPVESSSKSSKSKESDTPQKSARKFAVQPVETSSKSSRKQDEPAEKPKSRFAPQPLEMSTKSNRRKALPPDEDNPPSPKSSTPEPEKPKRRFAPQLIDTAKRTRKASDPLAPLPIHHKTDVVPSHNQDAKTKSESEVSTSGRLAHHLLPHERRRDRSLSRSSMRSHSFRCPDLETIESSESEQSVAPSLSTSPSSSADSPLTGLDVPISETYKHATRIRESVDETFSRYMLELEARRAELKLQEQALAAFPNSDYHEPVEHYVDEDDQGEEIEIDDRPATWEGHEDDEAPSKAVRRETTKMNWELQEMQRHHEELEQDRHAAQSTAKRVDSTPSPWWNPSAAESAKHKDTEFSQMQDRARPPMLGSDITFPRSASPEPARFDVTQGSHVLRNQMCYLTEQAEANSTNPASPDGLWLKANTVKRSGNSTQSQGLWGGFCVDSGESKTPGLAPPSGPTGLMTPMVEQGNPFEQPSLFKGMMTGQKPPPTPPNGTIAAGDTDAGMSNIDNVLHSERELDEVMEREYPDTFITQVYNYLSLGYPSLAWPFDEELAKISQMPLTELRHDDQIAKSMPKGYIRLGDDFEGRGDGSTQELGENKCARWVALKKYVREWAKQEQGMVPVDELGGNWGTGPRRGSWAW